MSENFEFIQPQKRTFSERSVVKQVRLEKQASDQSVALNPDGEVQVRLMKKMRECREGLGDANLDSVVLGTQDFYKWHMLKKILSDGTFDPYKMIEEFLEKDVAKFNEDAYWKAVDAIELYNRGY